MKDCFSSERVASASEDRASSLSQKKEKPVEESIRRKRYNRSLTGRQALMSGIATISTLFSPRTITSRVALELIFRGLGKHKETSDRFRKHPNGRH